jgi:hypothetical protein
MKIVGKDKPQGRGSRTREVGTRASHRASSTRQEEHALPSNGSRRSILACLIAYLLARSLAYLFICLFVWLPLPCGEGRGEGLLE